MNSLLCLARRVVLTAHRAQIVLHGVEGILIVGVGDFLTVDLSDFGILTAHTAVLECQRDDKHQQRTTDENRQKQTTFGPKSV